MAPSNKPSIVLVHGAWHVPAHYATFISLLEVAGFDVSCPLLPSCDDSKRHSGSDLYADAQLVRDHILSLLDQSCPVVMLLHSYGGAVGTEAARGLSTSERAAQGLQGGIVRLVYMCAFMLQVGESVTGESMPRPVPEPVKVDESDGTTFLQQNPVDLLFADVQPGDLAQEMSRRLVRQDGKASMDQVTWPAWSMIPTTYLRTEEDRMFFPDWQDRQIRKVRGAGTEVVVESFEASHSPFLSMPEEIVAAVERAAESA